ncbi:MAG: phosphoadenylyl-sulfate reductase [Candidatus Dadabacteria bacterium]|nr:phosphoadenylyl-sulfate reductase [Candidatus Dadabacteria bacterium]NIQ13476.1 phosphoadenylyl-sulfate reductase [Candidatus Dadabacteria bacterium]
MQFSDTEVERLNKQFEDAPAEEVLKWTLDNLHPKVGLATSFQFQGMVLIDMLMKIDSGARIFTLDTGRLNKETYDVIEEVMNKYDTIVEIIFPDKNEVEEMVNKHGINLFYRSVADRRMCCNIRKTRPLNDYLKSLDGWITSIRRDQTTNRASAKKFEVDYLHGRILKVNPIVDWTTKHVWDYIDENNVPYNKLHDIGYPSIGCAPCTRPVRPGEDPRSGRWWWETESDKECGIHFDYDSK